MSISAIQTLRTPAHSPSSSQTDSRPPPRNVTGGSNSVTLGRFDQPILDLLPSLPLPQPLLRLLTPAPSSRPKHIWQVRRLRWVSPCGAILGLPCRTPIPARTLPSRHTSKPDRPSPLPMEKTKQSTKSFSITSTTTTLLLPSFPALFGPTKIAPTCRDLLTPVL